jgi:hypothetical protein
MTTEGIRQHREAITEIPKSEQLRALHEFIYARPVKSVEVHTNLSRLQDTPLIAEYELADPDYQNKETYFERNVSECVTDLLAHCSVRHIDTSAEVFTVHGVVTSPLQIQSHTNFGGSRAAEPVVEGFVKDGDITTTLRRTDTVLQIETTFQHEHWLENQTDLYPIPRTQDDYLACSNMACPKQTTRLISLENLWQLAKRSKRWSNSITAHGSTRLA